MDLRKLKKSKSREIRKATRAEAPAGASVGDGSSETPTEAGQMVEDQGASTALAAGRREDAEAAAQAEAEAAERAEIAEVMYQAAAKRAETAEAMYRAALERDQIAEAREQAAAEGVAAVEGRERAAAERVAAVEAREHESAERVAAAAERVAAVEARVAAIDAREQATSERTAALEAREKAASERDAIANARDRTGAERDAIANTRDRSAAERDSIAITRPTIRWADTAETPDDAALELARLEAELQRAHLDALTGAFRREMGRLALRNEIERARRADGKFVIAFIDVDGLKGVNDRDGHAAGDRILRTLAATMRANLRSYDPIVRFGGDEFICGISSIGPDEAQHRIGVIDQSLRSATGVGITAGLASLTSNESLEELTARADAALIEAKRNRAD